MRPSKLRKRLPRSRQKRKQEWRRWPRRRVFAVNLACLLHKTTGGRPGSLWMYVYLFSPCSRLLTQLFQSLKKEVMPVVKNKSGNSAEARTTWSNLRRQITPKIGQLTDDPAQISRVVRRSLLTFIFQPNHKQ